MCDIERTTDLVFVGGTVVAFDSGVITELRRSSKEDIEKKLDERSGLLRVT